VTAGADVSRRELVSFDPATLTEVGRVAVTAPEEAAEIVAEARMAQRAFAREPLERRRRLLERVAHVLVDDADAIAQTIVAEAGKPLAEAYAHDLVVAADACRWHAANVERVLGEERLAFPQLVFRQKRGWRSSHRGTSRSRSRCARRPRPSPRGTPQSSSRPS
jgi:acyl-CoA reductase-like NAD-dependent aldehyde dehydrogenase